MDMDVKVCPSCGGEFFAHVEECSKCELPLVFPGEPAKETKPDESADGSLVLVEAGTPDRMKWLASKLKTAGMAASVFNMAEGDPCSCGTEYGLFVEQTLAVEASRKIEEVLLKAHPELQEIEGMITSGRCPACAAEIPYAVSECPDCGLHLGGGHDPSCGTGGCGPC